MHQPQPSTPSRGPALLHALAWCTVVPLGVLATYFVIGSLIVTTTGGEPILGTVVLGLVVLAVVVGLRLLRPRWLSYTPAAPPIPDPVRYAGLVALTLVLAFLAGQALALLLYTVFGSSGFDQASRTRAAAAPGVVLLLTLVVAPASEEALFRGLLYPLLRRRIPILVSAAVTATIFALMHANIVQVAAALPLALLAALVYESTRSLWPVVLTHAVFNAIAMILPPSWLTLIVNPVTVVLLIGAFGVCAWLLWTRVSSRDTEDVVGRTSRGHTHQ